MQVLSFPGCCTAKVIVGFGEENAASYRADKAYTDRTMAEELDRLIRGPQIGTGMGSIVVQLTSRQVMGIRVLTALGFASTVAQPKDNHSDTRLYTFTRNPREYINSVVLRDIYPIPAGEKPPKLLVRTLKPQLLRSYRGYQSAARLSEASGNLDRADGYRLRAKMILDNPAHHNIS